MKHRKRVREAIVREDKRFVAQSPCLSSPSASLSEWQAPAVALPATVSAAFVPFHIHNF